MLFRSVEVREREMSVNSGVAEAALRAVGPSACHRHALPRPPPDPPGCGTEGQGADAARGRGCGGGFVGTASSGLGGALVARPMTVQIITSVTWI